MSSGRSGIGQVRRFAPDGTAFGAAVTVNAFDQGHQLEVTAASLKDGGYVLTWTSEAQDGSGLGVFARRYDAAGAAVGGEFRVNTMTTGNQNGPEVTGLADGGFYIVWTSAGGTNSVWGDIYGQRYDATGIPVGGETRINTATSGGQGDPSVAQRVDGSLAVTWLSFFPDGSGVTWNDPGHSTGSSIQSRVLPPATIGGVGDDSLVGSAGPDLLFGSGGTDTLTGGLSADSFLFATPSDGLDTITDFQQGIDHIDVVGTAFGGLPTGALAPERFALNEPKDADDRFVFNTTTRILSYDPDGNGAMAATSIAVLNVGTFSTTDIRVVVSA